MTNKISSEQAVEHAWKYFELHSNQRITMFNYFLFIVVGLGTAIGVIIQSSITFAYIGVSTEFGPYRAVRNFVEF